MSDDERKEGSNRKLEVVHSGSGKESKSDKKGVEGKLYMSLSPIN